MNRYDHLGRRVQKIAPDGTHTFLYDGWRPVVETISKPGGGTDRIEYYWGRDLSGSLDGAAGVGALLYVKRNGSIFVPFCDAFGNVMGYWDENGAIVAEYSYDAFGRTVAKSGTMADVFSIRYSTKYYDAETGMYYYGKRYYLTALCRWLTRDPIEEQGGKNLYAFCLNDSVSKYDKFGHNVTLTTGNRNVSWLRAGNRYFHQEICVDTWVWNEKSCCWRRTGRRSFSFAATGLGLSGPRDDWLGLNSSTGPGVIRGNVYETDDQGLEDTEILETTPCQDRAFLKYLLSLDGKEDTYSLFGHNCRTFSQAMLNEARRRNSNNDWRCKYDNKCN